MPRFRKGGSNGAHQQVGGCLLPLRSMAGGDDGTMTLTVRELLSNALGDSLVTINGTDAERSVAYAANGQAQELLAADEVRAMLHKCVDCFEAIDGRIVVWTVMGP